MLSLKSCVIILVFSLFTGCDSNVSNVNTSSNENNRFSTDVNSANANNQNSPLASVEYFVHKNIKTTVFWVGELGNRDNKCIPNKQSAWDECWQKHFGGEDSPLNRVEKRYENLIYSLPRFEPKENPFYFALPYNDFTAEGRKPDAVRVIPWAAGSAVQDNESFVKNRWIKIWLMEDAEQKYAAYAQWQDAGPWVENDVEYVFGTDAPENSEGLDISPAVRDYLLQRLVNSTEGDYQCSWQFVNEANVPEGPWKLKKTTSKSCWKEACSGNDWDDSCKQDYRRDCVGNCRTEENCKYD